MPLLVIVISSTYTHTLFCWLHFCFHLAVLKGAHKTTGQQRREESLNVVLGSSGSVQTVFPLFPPSMPSMPTLPRKSCRLFLYLSILQTISAEFICCCLWAINAIGKMNVFSACLKCRKCFGEVGVKVVVVVVLGGSALHTGR